MIFRIIGQIRHHLVKSPQFYRLLYLLAIRLPFWAHLSRNWSHTCLIGIRIVHSEEDYVNQNRSSKEWDEDYFRRSAIGGRLSF